MCEKVSNIFITLKKDLFGCFRIEKICDKDNETGLKEGGVIEMLIEIENYSASIRVSHRNLNYSAPFACRSFALCLLTRTVIRCRSATSFTFKS